jgi:GNAT superfamily N-acetyltransferase
MRLCTNKDINKLALLHYNAYEEKFPNLRSPYLEDYLISTKLDLDIRQVYIHSSNKALIVLEDKTDILLRNSTYYLITRIYVSPELRGKGIAKYMLTYCKQFGPLMGYNGKFYFIKDKE